MKKKSTINKLQATRKKNKNKLQNYWVKLAEKMKKEEKKTEASQEAQNRSSKPAPGILSTANSG